MQNTERLGAILFRLSDVVSEHGFSSISIEGEEIAGCIIGVVLCWTGVVGVDHGVELVDSLRESFSREVIVTSKWSIILYCEIKSLINIYTYTSQLCIPLSQSFPISSTLRHLYDPIRRVCNKF